MGHPRGVLTVPDLVSVHKAIPAFFQQLSPPRKGLTVNGGVDHRPVERPSFGCLVVVGSVVGHPCHALKLLVGEHNCAQVAHKLKDFVGVLGCQDRHHQDIALHPQCDICDNSPLRVQESLCSSVLQVSSNSLCLSMILPCNILCMSFGGIRAKLKIFCCGSD